MTSSNRITVAEWKALLAKQRRKPKAKAKAAAKVKKPKKPPPRISWSAHTVLGRVEVRINGLKLVSELNMHEHWRDRLNRSRAQKNVVANALLGRNLWHWVELPLRITVWRIAPRRLDKGDNRESCAKWIRDQLAKHLGVNDGADGIEWQVDQRRGEPNEYGVEIVIESAERKSA